MAKITAVRSGRGGVLVTHLVCWLELQLLKDFLRLRLGGTHGGRVKEL